MDLKNWKKALVIGLVSAATCTSPSAFAAQANVTIDINFPTILVMYHFNTITLDLDQTSLGTYLVGGTAVPCGPDFCDDQANSTIAVPIITANTSVTSIVSDPGLANTTTEFTIVGAVGVRALGCSTYDTTVVDAGSDAGVTVDAIASLSAIEGASCSFTMLTGDLVFDVDFNLIDADPASAIFDVTIAGI